MKNMTTGMTLTALVAFLITPSLALAQKVSVDFDDKAPFATYKAYSWTEGTPSPNPLLEKRIQNAVEDAMTKAGFTKATSGTGDVVVATHAVGQQQKELVASGFGGGPRFGGGGTAHVETYVQGTLVVDMYDAKTKQLVWRGTGTDTVSDKPEKNADKVNNALQKMFKQYPPKKK